MATAVERAKAFLKLAKSVDDEVLADVAQINDITLDKDKVPSSAELGAGGSKEMRGFEAMHNRMEPGTLQMGVVRDYEELVGRLGRTEKALGQMASTLSKALELLGKSSAVEGLEAASQKIRKAKVIINKSEDDEDDDDFKDRMDKATTQLDAAKTLIEKAEEEADDEDKEAEAEKARGQYKKMRALVKAAHANRAADKLAKAEAAKKAIEDAEAATKKASEEKLAEEEAKESAEKARLEAEAASKSQEAPGADPALSAEMKSITSQLGVLTTSVAGMMSRIGNTSQGAMGAPMVVKAMPDNVVELKLSEKVSDDLEMAADNGVLDLGAVIKGRSLLNRLRMVEEGKIDKSVFDAEIASAPDNLKPMFATA
jgi:hypothetical protein